MKTMTMSQRIYYSEIDPSVYSLIRKDLCLYSSMLHDAYHKLYDVCFHNVERPKNLCKDLKLTYGTNDYFPLSAIHEAKALLKSNITCNTYQQGQTKKRIQRIQNKLQKNQSKIERIQKKLQAYVEKSKLKKTTEQDYLEEVQVWKPRLKQLQNQQKQLLFRMQREEYHLMGLKKRVKQSCFGGRKLMKKKELMPHDEWLKQYQFERSNRMVIPR